MKNRVRKSTLLLLMAVYVLTGCTNYMEEGTELLKEGDVQGAITAFEQAAEEAEKENEDSSEAYRGIGIAYYEQEDYESARTNLQRALDEGGMQTPIIYNLIGICSMRQQDYDGALAAFEQGIALPDSAVISEGTKLEQTADYDEVIQGMMRNRVVCYEKKLDWANAKSAMSEYITLYPDDPESQKEAEFLETR